MRKREFLLGGASLCGLALVGCDAGRGRAGAAIETLPGFGAPSAQISAMYGPRPDEPFDVHPIDIRRIPQRFWRRRVDYRSPQPPGSLVVDTRAFYLYLIEPGGAAIRYGVSLGRAGYSWTGEGVIGRKKPWPSWTPTSGMIARTPGLAQWSAANGGMPGGPDNPLGARALYIHQQGRDTLYRVHGTPEADSVGRAVSSGCVRMINQDAIDLYDRVAPGARILVV